MSSEGDFGVPRYQAQEQPTPQYQAAPQYDAASQYQAAPQYDAASQYQAAPQYQVSPQPQYLGQAYPQAQMAVAPAVLPKNPALGVILSFFIPGLGSMVNGSGARGAIILGVYIVGWILTLVLIGFVIVFGAWVWGLVDGYLSAQRWNLAHGIVS